MWSHYSQVPKLSIANFPGFVIIVKTFFLPRVEELLIFNEQIKEGVDVLEWCIIYTYDESTF